MEIFNKGDRSGYEEIVSYGPRWWTEYREMDAVYRYEGWCLDLMYHLMDRVAKNQFPTQADEAAIAIFEKLLHIEYDEEITLEERRRVVSVYYSGTGKLNQSTILALVKAYTGHDGELHWDGSTLVVSFNNDEGERVSIGLLQKALDRRIPAHIGFQTRCTARVTLGIKAAREAWQERFTAAGTVPMTSRGLFIADGEIAVETAAGGTRTAYPLSGVSGEAGTYPVTSKGTQFAEDGVAVVAAAEGLKASIPVSGDSGEAGTHPIQSTGLETAGESVLPEISTESWPVTYTVCGDTFDI